MPLCPYRLNSNGLGISGPGIALAHDDVAVHLVVDRLPGVLGERRLWSRTCRPGSTAAHEERDHRLRARLEVRRLRRVRIVPQRLGRARVARPPPRADPASSSRYASARPLMPPPARHRNSRRDQKYFMLCTASPHVKEFVRFSSTCVKSTSEPAFTFSSASVSLGSVGGSCQRDTIRRDRSASPDRPASLVTRSASSSACASTNGLFSSVSACVGTVDTLRAAGRDVHVRMIERLEHRIRQRAPLVDVDAAPPGRRTVGLVVPSCPWSARSPGFPSARTGRIGCPPIVRLMLPPTDEHAVAHRSRRRAAADGTATDSRFSGSVFSVAAVIEDRRHLVGLGRHHQLVDLLDAPAAVHELDRQPVEQLRMRRLLAHLAEVVERRDDAAAEVMLPEPIDDHARGQRIVRRREPLGERQPPARRAAVGPRNLGRRFAVHRHAEEARLHQRAVALESPRIRKYDGGAS